MSIFPPPRTVVATSCVEPRAQAIALSSLFATGALLLSASAIIGAIASLALLLALAGAFAVGYAIARWQPWPAHYCVTISCYAFVLSAIGWLLVLVIWNSEHGWLELIPGIVFGGLGLGIVWQTHAAERVLLGMMPNIPTIASIVFITLAILLTNHYADSGKGGFVYALAVLADLALLGAVLVKIRLQDEHSIKYE
ncbi:TPA: hypothetical protein M8J30_004857 [Klebsiella aerogenes]|uniref:hypothetical protein n=1 Tax=Klebsiella aerogenes TaxID=548 RepID=UPI000F7EF6F0|nr:hypothetical protein [Klebsiella aerogenes]MEB6076065.1 hypothetical protein [Klebsiella aerogenes]RSW52105.1 hypothetical protein EGH44_00695 [Klebsiella aerogenes]CAF9406699.1 hypothetical protein AI2913V1_1610 [Klebsiella aerogenes]CAH5864960.1 hypothetical protein AI2913V1_1610 [Klebsiella aerogenes]HCC8073661.1 hypothetical protein [Klebsiella aerogenes]